MAEESERGKPASYDRSTGEVHGSGSGTGASANPNEDYDQDPMSGGGSDTPGGPRPRNQGAERPTDPDEGV